MSREEFSSSLPIPDDLSHPVPDNLSHPANECTPLKKKMLEVALSHYHKGTPFRWEKIAKEFPGMTTQQVKHYGILLEQDFKKVEETSVRKGNWTEEEKGLFMSGLCKYGWGKWTDISRHVGTRLPEQVRNYARKHYGSRWSSQPENRQCMTSSINDIQGEPPEEEFLFNNGAIANPPLSPVMDYMILASNAPPPTWSDPPFLPIQRPLSDIDVNFVDTGCDTSCNLDLEAQMRTNPSSSIQRVPLEETFLSNNGAIANPRFSPVMDYIIPASNALPPTWSDPPFLPLQRPLSDVDVNFVDTGYDISCNLDLEEQMSINPSSTVNDQGLNYTNTMRTGGPCPRASSFLDGL